jgi:hypothetical protein
VSHETSLIAVLLLCTSTAGYAGAYRRTVDLKLTNTADGGHVLTKTTTSPRAGTMSEKTVVFDKNGVSADNPKVRLYTTPVGKYVNWTTQHRGNKGSDTETFFFDGENKYGGSTKPRHLNRFYTRDGETKQRW